ncbi:MAG: polar amino acid transport system permease protein, partial [Pseudonocardiales bacterium]|nr:polar amino acid transport system permease protein [Pseudonocardiales bacterium]
MAPAPQPIAPAGSPSWQPSALQRQRLAYRRSRTIRSGITAALSTVVLVAVVVGAITSSPGWPRVHETFFNWEKAKESF